MSSFGRRIADLINDQGKLKQSKVDGLDSSETLSIISTEVSSGVSYFDTLDSLPTTGLSEGLKALVNISSTEGRLYVYNGQGWYNADTNLNTSAPVWVTEPSAEYDIADSVTPLTITALASDPDSDKITNESFVSDSAQYMVTISNDSSVWTFTPKSADSIGIEVASGNLNDSNGDFIYTFKWSDGFNFISKAVTISYRPSAFIGTNQYFGDRGFSIAGSGTSGNTQAIHYFDLTTNSNSSSFGNTTGSGSGQRASVSDGNRIVTTGAGYNSNNLNLEYFASATLGNATSSGNTLLGSAQGYCDYNQCAGSDGLYGLYVGGYAASGYGSSKAQTIVVQTAGNATNYNGVANYQRENSTAVNNATRLVAIGGQFSTYTSPSRTMDYFSFQTQGNATDFGDIATQRHYTAEGNSNGVYGTFAGGITYHSGSDPGEHIQRITIATPSNASDIGDLGFNNASSYALRTRGHAGCGNSTHGYAIGGGGQTPSNNTWYGFNRSTYVHKWNMSTGGNSVSNPPSLSASIVNSSGASGNAS